MVEQRLHHFAGLAVNCAAHRSVTPRHQPGVKLSGSDQPGQRIGRRRLKRTRERRGRERAPRRMEAGRGLHLTVPERVVEDAPAEGDDAA